MMRFAELCEWPEDVTRVRDVAEQHGVILDLHEAEHLWQHHSDDLDAQWLGLPEADDELWDILRELIKEFI